MERDWVVVRLRTLEHNLLGTDMYTRLSEYKNQAQAWLELGEVGPAKEFLQHLLRAAFTVGNEKDYQLDGWIAWLDDINIVEPQRAAQRIGWFTQALLAVNQGTEGSAAHSAAQVLLATTFHWSPCRAIVLFHWLLKQRLLRYDKGMRILLRAALEHDHPPVALVLACVTHMLLPFSAEGDDELVALLVTTVRARKGVNAAHDATRQLLQCIERYALPPTRQEWRRGIKRAVYQLNLDMSQLGIDITVPPADHEHNASSDTLKLNDGTLLRVDQVNERVYTVQDIEVLHRSEDKDSYFDWVPVITHLAVGVDRSDLLKLADLFEGNSQAAHMHSVISQRLLALGHQRDAWTMAERALTTSRSFGWSRWYDGGTRLNAFRALVGADSVRARPLVWQTLLQDVVANPWLARSMAGNLTEVLPLLTDTVPVLEVWNEVEQHTHALFEGFDLPPYAWCDLTESPMTDGAEYAIADLVGAFIGHPVNMLSCAAQRICGLLLLEGNAAIRDVIHALLGGPEAGQEHLLVVLDAVSRRAPHALMSLHQPIAALQHSRNYAIRQAARIVSQRLGIDVGADAPRLAVVPTIYTLDLPPHTNQSLVGRGEVVAHEPLRDTQDPVESVHLYSSELTYIARAAGIDYPNLCRRVVQIMHELAPYSAWSAQGERQLRANLGSTGLRLPFRRTRSLLVRRALFHVTAELIDAGLIKPEDLEGLEPLLRFYDPAMLFMQPTVRPSYIPAMEGRKDHGTESTEWITAINEAANQVVSITDGGWTVLAEDSRLKYLDFKTPKETRRSVVCLVAASQPSLDDEGDLFFATVIKTLVSEYPMLSVDAHPTPLIVRHVSYGYDSPGAEWIALNPVIGRQLGWRVAEDGLFRWIDPEGHIMVESVWWTDGLQEQADIHARNEVGEGWLVIASPVAAAHLRRHYGLLKRHMMVAREYHDNEQGRIRKDTSKEVGITL